MVIGILCHKTPFRQAPGGERGVRSGLGPYEGAPQSPRQGAVTQAAKASRQQGAADYSASDVADKIPQLIPESFQRFRERSGRERQL